MRQQKEDFMKLAFTIEKKHFYVLVTLLVLTVGIVAVNAYNTNSARNFGHTSGEVDIEIKGTTKSLQQAVDSGDFAGRTVIARHSLTPAAPDCPDDWDKLWEGYSFAGAYLASGYGSAQDLGKPGSCMENFAPIPVTRCNNNEQCEYFSGDLAMWLYTANTPEALEPISKIEPKIGRCSVCERSAPILVRHSLDDSQPAVCPNGWSKLWEGFSYGGGYLNNNFEAGQDLSSPGSCLEKFTPQPWIECNKPFRCTYKTSGDFSMWLSKDALGGAQLPPVSGNEAIQQRIAECVVCSR